jgi:hypothetical protein
MYLSVPVYSVLENIQWIKRSGLVAWCPGGLGLTEVLSMVGQ